MADLAQIKVDSTTYDIKDTISVFGGRNLMRYTTTFTSASSVTSTWSFTRVTDASAPGGSYFQGTCTAAGAGGYHCNTSIWGDYNSKCTNGTNYCFSVWVKSNRTGNLNSFGLERFSPVIRYDVALASTANTWKKLWKVGTFNTSTTYQSCVFYNLSAGNWAVGDTLCLALPKLELGTKPTDWTPAPEDLVTVSGTQLVLY